MDNKTDSLIFKFAVIFLLFVIVTLTLSGVNAYFNQRAIYKTQCEEHLVHIAQHMEHLLKTEGKVFDDAMHYFVQHKDDILVPIDYDGNWQPFWHDFITGFRTKYPGKTLGIDMNFTDMDADLQRTCAIYMHRKWLAIFEEATKDFHIKYIYYLMPSEKPLYMFWVIDCVREEKVVNGKKYIDLCTEVLEPLERHQKMWQAWTTGAPALGYDTFDNEYGKTYAYYTAVHLGGKKTGVIGTEINIADVDTAILKNTLIQMAGLGSILVLCVAGLLILIYKKYILKLIRLQNSVMQYTQEKDPAVVTSIENNAEGKDEISSLSIQTAAMILELENYMRNLKDTTLALDKEKERAEAMNKLANEDALTGIRNKTAYDKETKRLTWAIEDKSAQFGIAVIDLNFLKRINDTYGHEQGNISIKKLCHIVCTVFKHSPVFRIGGDEFAVILENTDYANAQDLENQFHAILDSLAQDTTLEQWERVSAAIGMAFFDPIKDDSVDNVFKRADKAMYAHKKAMKAVREQ